MKRLIPTHVFSMTTLFTSVTSIWSIFTMASPWTTYRVAVAVFVFLASLSHPIPYHILPWHESHCSRCCWLLSWHHGPCPVASWHQKCKKTWNMWQEAIWEAGGGRGSFVLGFKMFVFRLFNLFPPDSQLIPTGTFKPPTCWLPLVLGGSAVVKMIHVNQPPGA